MCVWDARAKTLTGQLSYTLLEGVCGSIIIPCIKSNKQKKRKKTPKTQRKTNSRLAMLPLELREFRKKITVKWECAGCPPAAEGRCFGSTHPGRASAREAASPRT